MVSVGVCCVYGFRGGRWVSCRVCVYLVLGWVYIYIWMAACVVLFWDPLVPIDGTTPPNKRSQSPPQPHKPALSELLDSKKKTLVLCHHGGRSMQVASFLASQAGFEVRPIQLSAAFCFYIAICSVACRVLMCVVFGRRVEYMAPRSSHHPSISHT